MIQYSYEGDNHTCDPHLPRFRELDNWLPLGTFTNYAQPVPGPIDFPVRQVTAQCVRVFGTELSQDDYGYPYMQLGRMQVYRPSG